MIVTKERLINIGAEKLADIVISIYENNKDMQKQIDIILAGAAGNSKKISSMIKKEVSVLEKLTRFIDCFVDSLDKLRLHITNDLMLASPIHAADLITNFINLQEFILMIVMVK